MTTIQNKIQKIADKVCGEVYKGYSGRGMYGAQCWGIVCPHSNVQEAIRMGSRMRLGKASWDSMGLDAIVYWPSIKFVKEAQIIEVDGTPDNLSASQGERETGTSEKEDITMTKIEKKAARIAENQAKKLANVEVEKHSKLATIKSSIPKHVTPEQAIVAKRIADGDEATAELLKIEAKDTDEKVCPSCNTSNPKGKVTCSNCGEKLYKSSKIASKVASKAEAKSKVKVQKEASVRYARKDSVADAILELKTFTEEELINKADSLFSQNGGKSNLKESKAVASFILPAIVRMGVVKVEGKEFTLKKEGLFNPVA